MDTTLIPLVLLALGTGIVGTAFGLRDAAQTVECPECPHCRMLALERVRVEEERRRREDDLATWYGQRRRAGPDDHDRRRD